MRTFRNMLGIAVLAIVVFSGYLFGSGKFDWRAKIVTAKLRGAMPYMSWANMAVWLGPSWAKPAQYPTELDRVRVVVAAEEEGPCPILWDTPAGRFWGRSTDDWTLRLLSYEQKVETIYQPDGVAIREGDVVLDVGAHLGTFTRDAVRRGAGLVVAFEPNPSTATCFKKTFAKELVSGQIILIEEAVSDSPGTLSMSGEGAGATTALGLRAPGGTEVPATTIDIAARHLSLQTVDFIKMDIEGSERLALAGSTETLRRFHPRMAICTYHRWDDPLEIPSLVLRTYPTYKVWTQDLKVAYFTDHSPSGLPR